MIVTPYVAIIIEEGMQELDSDLIEMGESFGADGDLIWKNIYIPHLYPHIFASIRLSFTLAWKITLVAELFATKNGVGQVSSFFFQSQRNDMIIAWTVPMMVLMYGIEKTLKWSEQRKFDWREELEDANLA